MQQTFEVNIVLVGVSGAGKTTLGRLASKNLGIGLNHCQKADHTLRIESDIAGDAKELVNLIKKIIF